MRISSWVIGFVSLIGVVLVTAACAVLTFGAVRGVVVDLWDSGVQVESPAEVVSAITNPSAFAQASPTPAVGGGETVVVLPSVTPMPTVAIETTDTSTDTTAETPVATSSTIDINTQAVQATPTPPTSADGQNVVLDASGDYTWRDPRQIRILLMGIDQRTGTGVEDRGPFRTDTMIVVNVDPVRRTAGVISFPRDLWVKIPNFDPARINTANYIGDLNAYPGGGGPVLAMETIAANFGIPVERYVTVNFDVFETVVDTLAPNGVEVCITETIRDPDYPDDAYGTINVEFDPGCQPLDAVRLLQYARTRATQGGDFDRARRQQQTLDALRATLLSAGGVGNFITQAPVLWQELSDSYRTNLSLEEIISLGFLLNEIPRDNINYAVIDNNYVELGTSPTDEQILIPIPARINDLIQRVFYPQIEVTEADLLARSQNENATIRVYNGTSIAGLAGRTREWLVGRGIVVAEVGNDETHGGALTEIRDYGNNRWTAQYLAELLGIPPERIIPGTDGLASNGIIIVAGSDMESIISGQ
jgi:LCP family protein required for cell wall assembly